MYRTGNCWGVTIVREGTQPPTTTGTRADDQLVAVVTNNDAALAERICALLNGDAERELRARTHPGETWWWPTECAQCGKDVGPWSPDTVSSTMTHIVSGGGPDWEANRDHEPVTQGVKW